MGLVESVQASLERRQLPAGHKNSDRARWRVLRFWSRKPPGFTIAVSARRRKASGDRVYASLAAQKGASCSAPRLIRADPTHEFTTRRYGLGKLPTLAVARMDAIMKTGIERSTSCNTKAEVPLSTKEDGSIGPFDPRARCERSFPTRGAAIFRQVNHYEPFRVKVSMCSLRSAESPPPPKRSAPTDLRQQE